MIRARLLLAAALVLGGGTSAFAAGPFECPAKPLEAAQAASIKALLPSGDAFEQVDRLDAAVNLLKAQGVNPVLVVDNLIAAYCPLVAERTGLSDAQKASRVTRFAAHVTRVVYSLAGADEIILDVAFPPLVVDAIRARAQAAGVSPEAFIQAAVNAALK